MKKIMISQPMTGLTDDEIMEIKDRATAKLTAMGYEVINTFFTDGWYSEKEITERGVVNISLCYLAKSLESMSLCNSIYFVKGWNSTRGCRIEYDAALAYGIDIIME